MFVGWNGEAARDNGFRALAVIGMLKHLAGGGADGAPPVGRVRARRVRARRVMS